MTGVALTPSQAQNPAVTGRWHLQGGMGRRVGRSHTQAAGGGGGGHPWCETQTTQGEPAVSSPEPVRNLKVAAEVPPSY